MLACFCFVSVLIFYSFHRRSLIWNHWEALCRSGGTSGQHQVQDRQLPFSSSPERAEAQSHSEANQSSFSKASPLLQAEGTTHWILGRSLSLFRVCLLMALWGRHFYIWWALVFLGNPGKREIHQLGSKELYMMCSYSELSGFFYRLYCHMAQSSVRRTLQNSGCSSLQSTRTWFTPTTAHK